MFRGTCIGLSEYLVQIPQKKRQQNNCLYATSYIMYFFIFIICFFLQSASSYANIQALFPGTLPGVILLQELLESPHLFQYKDFLACLKQVKRLYLHSMAYLNDITFTDIIIFFSYDVINCTKRYSTSLCKFIFRHLCFF